MLPHCFVQQSYNFAHDKYHEKWIETELIIDWFIFRWIVNYESIHFWNELNWMNQFIGFQNESWMWINSKNKWMDTGLVFCSIACRNLLGHTVHQCTSPNWRSEMRSETLHSRGPSAGLYCITLLANPFKLHQMHV